MMDDPGQPIPTTPEHLEENRTTTDALEQQTVSLNTAQAAQQLEVDARTVRRYITEKRLKARQVKSSRGLEWQIFQSDLDAFKEERDRAATEGQEAGLTRAQESQALATTVGIIAAELERRERELERRELALSEAQVTIERLALDAGRQAGRNEELEKEAARLRERVAQLEIERDQLKAEKDQGKGPRRVKLLPWQ